MGSTRAPRPVGDTHELILYGSAGTASGPARACFVPELYRVPFGRRGPELSGGWYSQSACAVIGKFRP